MESKKCLIITSFDKSFTNDEIMELVNSYNKIINKHIISELFINKNDFLSNIILKNLNLKIKAINCDLNENSNNIEINEFINNYNIDYLIVVGVSYNNSINYNSFMFHKKIKIYKLCCRESFGTYFFE